MASQSDLDKQASDLRERAAAVDEHGKSLRDAMNALNQAYTDLKNTVENDNPVALTALDAAVADVVAAVGRVTHHGGPSPDRTVEAPDAPVAKKA